MSGFQDNAKWLDQYCSAVVGALHAELEDVDGDIDHMSWFPEEANCDDPYMMFEIMRTNPESEVNHFVWTYSAGWGYRLDSQDPDEETIPLLDAPGGNDLHHTETPGMVAYAAARTIAQHMRDPYLLRQIRAQLTDDAASCAVHNVLRLHSPEYDWRRQEWWCTACVDSFSHASLHPCPTLQEVVRAFRGDRHAVTTTKELVAGIADEDRSMTISDNLGRREGEQSHEWYARLKRDHSYTDFTFDFERILGSSEVEQQELPGS